MKRHEKTHQEQKQYPCRWCEKIFATREGLRKHGVEHRDFSCKFCGEQFQNRTNEVNHVRQVHGITSVMFPCNKCPQEFDSKGAYFIHLRTHKTEPKTCKGCKETFADKYMLTQHLKVREAWHFTMLSFNYGHFVKVCCPLNVSFSRHSMVPGLRKKIGCQVVLGIRPKIENR